MFPPCTQWSHWFSEKYSENWVKKWILSYKQNKTKYKKTSFLQSSLFWRQRVILLILISSCTIIEKNSLHILSRPSPLETILSIYLPHVWSKVYPHLTFDIILHCIQECYTIWISPLVYLLNHKIEKYFDDEWNEIKFKSLNLLDTSRLKVRDNQGTCRRNDLYHFSTNLTFPATFTNFS